MAEADTQVGEYSPKHSFSIYKPPVTNVGERPGQMEEISFEELHAKVKSEEYVDLLRSIRELAPYKNERGPDGKLSDKAKKYRDLKKNKLPFTVPSGIYEAGHRHGTDPQKPTHYKKYLECKQGGAHLPIPSGIRFLEMDNLDEESLAAARENLEKHPSVMGCWLSPGGNGLHIFVMVDPQPTNDAEAHAAYAAAAGTLGIAETGDSSVKNLARPAFVSADATAYMNPNSVVIPWPPAHVRRKPSKRISGEKLARIEPAQESAVMEALDRIPPPEGYNEWMGWLYRIKAAGLTCDVADDWSRKGVNYEEGLVSKKWEGLKPDETKPEALNNIIGYAVKHHGLDPKRAVANARKRDTSAGKGAKSPGKAKKATSDSGLPPPSLDTLTPDYQAAWLAHVARDVLVVVRDPNAGKRDGQIFYGLYAVNERTGMLDCGELLTRYRSEASNAYLLSVNENLLSRHQQRDFVDCAKHARDIRIASNAAVIADNIGMSIQRYPLVWAGIPVVTPADLDADLSVIGTPDGVWSIPAHRLLTAHEARDKLCTAQIRWVYDPQANHPEATALFHFMYGDLDETTTVEFARWRQAATALVRRPMREIIVKIAPTQSAKTTEGNLQVYAFHPLVVDGERAAIESSRGYNAGGASHNSYLAGFRRPARRVNVSEVVDESGAGQRPLNGQLLRDLSEASEISFRIPGPHEAQRVSYDAHLFIDGNLPRQGQDLLSIATPGNDSAEAIKSRLRGSPYSQIPEEEQRPELQTYGDPSRASSPETKEEINHFNRTLVRLMFDGMYTHYDLLVDNPLPKDEHSSQVVQELQNSAKPEWQVKWLPQVLRQAEEGETSTHTLEVYESYLSWHDENAEGKPESRRAITNAVTQYYKKMTLGEQDHQRRDGKQISYYYCPGYALATLEAS